VFVDAGIDAGGDGVQLVDQGFVGGFDLGGVEDEGPDDRERKFSGHRAQRSLIKLLLSTVGFERGELRLFARPAPPSHQADRRVRQLGPSNVTARRERECRLVLSSA
jgi:hypothetical protein